MHTVDAVFAKTLCVRHLGKSWKWKGAKYNWWSAMKEKLEMSGYLPKNIKTVDLNH